MYDDPWYLSPHLADPSAYDGWQEPPPDERLIHLVLVDGRLVDVWREPVDGTRWQHHADRFDRERRPDARPFAPAPPLHEQVLTWLDAAAGGRESLMGLTTTRLEVTEFEPDPDLRPLDREKLATVVDLLGHAARELRSPEAHPALVNCLLAAWEGDPEGVLAVGDAPRIAGGLAWVDGLANGLLGAGGVTTQARIQDATGCRAQLSVAGRCVRQLLTGYWPDPPRVSTLPDLLLVGRPRLLTSGTRRRLVRARDQALAAQAVADQAMADGETVRSA